MNSPIRAFHCAIASLVVKGDEVLNSYRVRVRASCPPPRRRAPTPIPPRLRAPTSTTPSPSRSHAPEPALGPSRLRHGDAESDAALPQVPRRAAARPRAVGGAVVVVRRGRGRGRGRAGDRDGLASALRPPLRAPQHRGPLWLQVPPPPTPNTPPRISSGLSAVRGSLELASCDAGLRDGSFSARSRGI